MEADVPSKFIRYDGLVLSGGGVKGIGELGVVKYYHEIKKIDVFNLKVGVGTSIGSVISLLLLCGYTPMEIFSKSYVLKNIIPIPSIFEIYEGIKSGGITSLDPLMELLSEMIIEKLEFIPTSQQLRDMGKTLVVSVGNVSKARGEYFSYRNRPEMSVIDMVKMSCNLPFLFKKIRYDGDLYVDGGFTDNFPSECIELKECKNVLGIAIISKSFFSSDDSIFSYPYNIGLMSTMNSLHSKLKKILSNYNPNKLTLIRLSFNNSSILDFGMDSTKKMDMFIKGYEEAKIEDTKEYLYIEGWGSEDGWDEF